MDNRHGQSVVGILEAMDLQPYDVRDPAGLISEIAEEVDLPFAPGAARRLEDLIEEGQDDEMAPEVADPPEAIVNGIIDLGRIATDALLLAIDPYPRKPGAVFETDITAPDPEDHPFAALKALQDNQRGKKKGK